MTKISAKNRLLPRETSPPERKSGNTPASSPAETPAKHNLTQRPQPERPCRDCGRAVPGFVNPITGTLLAPALCPVCEANQQEQREKARLALQEQHRQSRIQQIRELLAGAGVPPRYLDCSVANYTGYKPVGRPTALIGSCGTGKTHLAVGYLREWIIENGPTGVWFQRSGNLVRQLRQCCGDHASESEENLIRRLGQELSFLVLDDLGAEALTDFSLQGIYDVLDMRYAYNLPMIITSNLDVGQIAMAYGDRFMSRLMAMGEVFELFGDDYRLVMVEAQQAKNKREENKREENKKMH